ncbi:hypothetical protein D3C87_2109100 [compost metagenome]
MAQEDRDTDGNWQLIGYHDFVLGEGIPKVPKVFTEEEKAAAAEALVKLFVVNSKKVA